MNKEEHEICRVKVIVEGQVQGVGFRAFTRNRAAELGLTGWVRNMVDGRVETEAQGNRPDLESFLRSMRQGPTLAFVTNLDVTWLAAQSDESAFHIVY